MFLAVTLLLSATLAASVEQEAAGAVGDYATVVSLPRDGGGEIDDAQVEKVRHAPGVASVEPVMQTGLALGQDTFVMLATAPPPGAGTYVRGREPGGNGEIALDENALAALQTEVGRTVTAPGMPETPGAQGSQTPVRLTVVGVFEHGPEIAVPASMPAAIATNATIASVAGPEAGYTEVRVVAAPGSTPEQVRDAVAAVVDPGLVVLTGRDDVDRRVQELAGGHDVFAQVLLVFAAVALMTCMIVVSNTFRILLAQRQRQLALLRCVGAGRGQLVRAVLVEALLLGVVASLAGILVALVLGQLGVMAAHRYAGDIVSIDRLEITPTAVLVPLGVGVVLTLAAALMPAVRATRTSPLAALRPELPPTGRVRGIRVVLGLTVLIAGGALLALGVRDGRLEFGIAGGCLSFVGVLALGPVLVPVLVGRARGLARRVVGAPGVLAVENARRNPQRAAATTSALLVGVTLITMMTVGATIARQVVADEISSQLPVDATASVFGPGAGLTPEQVRRLSATEGVAAAAQVRTRDGVSLVGSDRDGGSETTITAVDDSVHAVVRAPRMLDGLAPGVVLLDRGTAGMLGIGDGGTVTLPWGRATARVTGVGGPVVLVGDVPKSHEWSTTLWLRFGDDADPADVAAALNTAAAGMEGGQITSGAQQRAEIDRAVDAVLLVAIALLAVAVLIALVGVGNTLGLSVLERTRESALLRALGLTAGQLRGMLAVEAVVVSAVAVVIGVALGIGYGWAGITTLFGDIPNDGVPLVVPWPRIALIAAVALGAGLLASVLPARRAATIAPAQGLASE